MFLVKPTLQTGAHSVALVSYVSTVSINCGLPDPKSRLYIALVVFCGCIGDPVLINLKNSDLPLNTSGNQRT